MKERMKRCSVCNIERSAETGYYRDSRARDGHQARCKDCDSRKGAHWRQTASEKKRAGDRAYRQALPIEKKREMFRRQQKQRQPKRTVEQRQRRAANPERSRANHIVRRGVAMGVLTKPSRCQRCGAGGRIEGSHDDYSRPLVVEWLCVRCHRRKDGFPGFEGEQCTTI